MRIGNLILDNPVLLAPMAGVTDLPFRVLAKELGAAMVFSEMVSAKGLVYGSRRTLQYLATDDRERPVAIQIFGSEPEIMHKAAKMVSEQRPDAIDINMGCPTPKIVSNGDGSALMKNPALAGEVARAVVEATSLPVTVKMRAGWDAQHKNAVEVATFVEKAGVKAVTVHGRTRDQLYRGRADWSVIKEVKETLSIPVIGNGDVTSPEAAAEMMAMTGCDAVMIGRGALGNPWIFRDVIHYLNTGEHFPTPSPEERIALAFRHLSMAVQFKGGKIAIREMRAHLAWYLKGLPGANRIKKLVNTASTKAEVEAILQEYLAGGVSLMGVERCQEPD